MQTYSIGKSITLTEGDAKTALSTMGDDTVHCCVTSPPYWNLRDYGVNGQIGMEPTPEAYVETIVDVFRAVRRVLRPDGTLWLNLGDSYASGGRGGGGAFMKERGNKAWKGQSGLTGWRSPPPGLKHKDLVGIPWRVALAMQADGWYLRQDIVWHKPNAMPESVRDRCQRAHEYMFLLSKSSQYYYDLEAVKVPCAEKTRSHRGGGLVGGKRDHDDQTGRVASSNWGKSKKPRVGNEWVNRRSVWSISTRGFRGAHFATFPPDLIAPCILAGCPDNGVVLDPFAGTGTTAVVASQHHRKSILIELNPEYVALARQRLNCETSQMRLPLHA
jgi:DNA modification methylase